MENDNVIEKIGQLRKTISTLKWDISMINNQMLRSIKEKKLEQYSKELEELTKSFSAS